MKKGYTKKVLKAQIRKYKEALKMNDGDFEGWLSRFGSWAFCPVCHYRNQFVSSENYGCKLSGFEPCTAIVNGRRCDGQYWFKVVNDGGLVNFPKIRRNIAKRLKFWQKIYNEKYPEKS